MLPKIDHIQITVKNLQESEAFYDQLLPLFGFDLNRKSRGCVEAHSFEVVEYMHEDLILGFNSPREALAHENVHRRRPGALHHLAFRAASIAEIQQLFPLIEATGAQIVEPPRYYPQHGANYYALFFKDPSGIKLELMCEEAPI